MIERSLKELHETKPTVLEVIGFIVIVLVLVLSIIFC